MKLQINVSPRILCAIDYEVTRSRALGQDPSRADIVLRILRKGIGRTPRTALLRDEVADFLQDSTSHPDAGAWVAGSALYARYVERCRAADIPSVTMTAFGERAKLVLLTRRTASRREYYVAHSSDFPLGTQR